MHSSRIERFPVMLWEALPHAMLYPDGSAKITEPNFDGDIFWGNVFSGNYQIR
jgi:hypothetical protein